jgi:hypothetical protein
VIGDSPVPVDGGDTLVDAGGRWGEATPDRSRGLGAVKTEGGGTDVGFSSTPELGVVLEMEGEGFLVPPIGLTWLGGVLLS